ncbi:non-ribosomal peptide synthetase [Paracidovorax oryzae]|uniref:non-ribosomal peptide synthetase n=1 Tax=Paracidovorax oryzae TaxID=862720 RepID=UPI0035D06726
MTSVMHRLSEIVRRQPQAAALISDAQTLSYQDLGLRIAQIARSIDAWFQTHLGREAGSGDAIGICMGKSTDLYASILAILATGASYVPVDPSLTAQLQAHILETCNCRLVLAAPGTRLPVSGVCVAPPGEAAGSHPSQSAAWAFPCRATGRDRCYTIFTSGSTGRPKGVQIRHDGVLHLVDWVLREIAPKACHRVLQYSTINFDASVLDIFPALLAGATLCIPRDDQRLSATALAEFCARHGIHQAFLPPAMLSVLDPQQFPALETLLTGGEACSPAVIQAWAAERRFYNLYGPTECTVLVAFKRMEACQARTNIGQAIDGARLHVLDEQMQPAARGELHVAGPMVSPGYMGDSLATARKFVLCPEVDEGRLYKTGDIVERDAHGDLHFLGRLDRQVKVRGFRVELEEIEGALVQSGCLQAAVRLSPQGQLVAYVALPPQTGLDALRQQLAQHLSDYKIPQCFIPMQQLPLKVNGKVDFDALPATAPRDAAVASSRPCEPILSLWEEILDLPQGSLDAHSDFQEVGGTSIKAIRLLSAIEERFGTRIRFSEFLENPTPHFLYNAIPHP